jgi:hypothetical protein
MHIDHVEELPRRRDAIGVLPLAEHDIPRKRGASGVASGGTSAAIPTA